MEYKVENADWRSTCMLRPKKVGDDPPLPPEAALVPVNCPPSPRQLTSDDTPSLLLKLGRLSLRIAEFQLNNMMF